MDGVRIMKTDWLVVAFMVIAAGTNIASIIHTLLH